MTRRGGTFSKRFNYRVFGARILPWIEEYAEEALDPYGVGDFKNLLAVFLHHKNDEIVLSDNSIFMVATLNANIPEDLHKHPICSVSGEFVQTANEPHLLMRIDDIKVVDRHLKYCITPKHKLKSLLSAPPKPKIIEESFISFDSILDSTYYDGSQSVQSQSQSSTKRKMPSPVALPKPKRVCFQEKDSCQKKRIHAESSGLRVRIRQKVSRLIVSKKRKFGALSKKVIDSSRPKKRTRLQDRMVVGLSNLANKQKNGEFNAFNDKRDVDSSNKISHSDLYPSQRSAIRKKKNSGRVLPNEDSEIRKDGLVERNAHGIFNLANSESTQPNGTSVPSPKEGLSQSSLRSTSQRSAIAKEKQCQSIFPKKCLDSEDEFEEKILEKQDDLFMKEKELKILKLRLEIEQKELEIHRLKMNSGRVKSGDT